MLTYVRLGLSLVLAALVAREAKAVFAFLNQSDEAHLLIIFFILALLFLLSFVIFYLSATTALPSFVVAIFFGVIMKPLLSPIIAEQAVLGASVGIGATLILFSGGLETPWNNFKRLILKILSLSFAGLLLTAFLFSTLVSFIGALFGIFIPAPVSILLGAVLASTDPAAIIPLLKRIRFTNRDTKDIIISESAVTDVTGTLLTVVFLSLITSGIHGAQFESLTGAYRAFFTSSTVMVLVKQIGFGVILGVCGYSFLEFLIHFKRKHKQEFEADFAYFLFVPLVIFTITISLGGSGYLAAFIAGLLFVVTENLHETERFFNQTIDGFLKPTIFLLLGALVDVQSLISYAPVGLLAAFVFMFIIRPLVVFATLGPFAFFGKNRVGLKELLFISCVRETGAIPAVLLVTIVSLGMPELQEGLVPIGMWVILATLIIEPPLTPLLARWLKVGTIIQDQDSLHINGSQEICVVLGSRGDSYIKRLPFVADWAVKHNIKRVVLLHCLEANYTEKRAREVALEAEGEFAKVAKKRELEGKRHVEFSLVSRKGFLQKNIDDLSKAENNVAVIFVGRRVLDYRLSEIKNLAVPLFFIK